jgi:hypothetical protein
MQVGRQTDRRSQKDIQTNRQTNRQADRQTGRQTDKTKDVQETLTLLSTALLKLQLQTIIEILHPFPIVCPANGSLTIVRLFTK